MKQSLKNALEEKYERESNIKGEVKLFIIELKNLDGSVKRFGTNNLDEAKKIYKKKKKFTSGKSLIMDTNTSRVVLKFEASPEMMVKASINTYVL